MPGLKNRRRLGPQQASKFNPRGSGFVAKYPLEWVQIDHTKVDLILIDEKTGCRLGRPTLTLAIDVYSRMVLGYYVSFEPPGALATGLCISQAILPKEEWLREHADAFSRVPEWPCFGSPVSLHMDNGGDFRGDMVKRACEKYGIDAQFRPVKTPQFGAHIESLIGKFMRDVHSIPGTTFSNVVERGKNYDSEAEAVLGLHTFKAWLANQILCIYHHTSHSAPELEGRTPIEQWNHGMYVGSDDTPPRGLLPDRYLGKEAVRLSLDFLPFEECVVSEKGLRVNKIQYQTLALRRWIGTKDPNDPKKSRYFVVRFDPRDLSRVYFWNEDTEEYEAIPYRTVRPPVTLWEFRASQRRLREARNLPFSKQNESMVFAGIKRQDELEAAAVAQKGKIKQAGRFQPGHHANRPLPKEFSREEVAQSSPARSTSGRDDVTAFDDDDLKG